MAISGSIGEVWQIVSALLLFFCVLYAAPIQLVMRFLRRLNAKHAKEKKSANFCWFVR
jgi:hypothetical protein